MTHAKSKPSNLIKAILCLLLILCIQSTFAQLTSCPQVIGWITQPDGTCRTFCGNVCTPAQVVDAANNASAPVWVCSNYELAPDSTLKCCLFDDQEADSNGLLVCTAGAELPPVCPSDWTLNPTTCISPCPGLQCVPEDIIERPDGVRTCRDSTISQDTNGSCCPTQQLYGNICATFRPPGPLDAKQKRKINISDIVSGGETIIDIL